MEKLYTCEQVADRYSVKVRTVWTWINEGKLKAIKIGDKLYRIAESELQAFETKKNSLSD